MSYTVRPADPGDVPAMAALAARLVRQHHGEDPLRFMLPEHIERGYARLVPPRAAELRGRHARRHGRSWGDRRLHPRPPRRARPERGVGVGVGEALLRAPLDGLRALGAPRCVLHTMWCIVGARRLFERVGFRRTMIEMTCELP